MFCPHPARAASGNLKILTPPDQSSFDGPWVDLVFDTGHSSADAVRVTLNGKLLPNHRKMGKGKIRCFGEIKLARGMNHIQVALEKSGKTLEKKTVSAFLGFAFSGLYSDLPDGFQPYYFHNDKQQSKCGYCHDLTFSNLSATPSSPDKSPCYICHRKLASEPYVHGPVSVGACTMCHDQKTKETRVGVLSPAEKVCMPCHSDSIDQWKKNDYQHGPTAMGACTACHDPHGSSHEYFLKMETTDLCSSCHEDTASKPHLITFFGGGAGHPVYRKDNPFSPGTEFNCASCHNPHGSSNRYVLRYPEHPWKKFCIHCHNF